MNVHCCNSFSSTQSSASAHAGPQGAAGHLGDPRVGRCPVVADRCIRVAELCCSHACMSGAVCRRPSASPSASPAVSDAHAWRWRPSRRARWVPPALEAPSAPPSDPSAAALQGRAPSDASATPSPQDEGGRRGRRAAVRAARLQVSSAGQPWPSSGGWFGSATAHLLAPIAHTMSVWQPSRGPGPTPARPSRAVRRACQGAWHVPSNGAPGYGSHAWLPQSPPVLVRHQSSAHNLPGRLAPLAAASIVSSTYDSDTSARVPGSPVVLLVPGGICATSNVVQR